MATPTPDSYTFTLGTTLYAGRASSLGGTLLTSFTLDNWDSVTPTRVLFRGGHPFKKGDIPSGSVPEIRRAGGAPVVAQFDERSTWSDGSLKFAVCHMRDTDLASSASQAYEIYSVTGSFDNTGTKTLASIVATDAITVELSSFAQWDGTSSATRGSGAALLDVSALSTVATRVTKIHSGPVCETYQIWGMFKDGADGSGSEDAHAKGIAYLSVWKDVSDAVIDTEFAVELAQDWWGVASKFRLDYTATLKRNGTTVQAYTGVQHPYHCHWMTARMTDDNNHGKRHWVGSVPTLTYLFDQDYWVSTHVVPPYDTTVTADANAAQTLVPLSSQGHRASLDAGGGYLGRGILPDCDARTFLRQTPADVRSSRVNAFAGLHVNKHFRDERTRTRPSESADVANTLIPLILLPKAESVTTITGLPAPKHAYRGSSTDLPSGQGGYEAVSGGSGVWTTTENASHAVAYSLFMYLLEGERYFLESSIDLATYNTQTANGNQFASYPPIMWYSNTSARSEMSIPATRWAAIPSFTSQERNLGWSANNLAVAGIIPDNDPQGEYMRIWNSHCADYLVEGLTYTPPSLLAAGTMNIDIGSSVFNMRSPWMQAFVVMGCAYNYLLTEEQGFQDYADMVGRSLAALINRHRYEMAAYRWMQSPILQAYASGNYLSADDYLYGPIQVTVASNVLTVTGSDGLLPMVIGDGDVFYFVNRDAGTGVVALPSGYTEGTALYAKTISGATCLSSATPGGSTFTVPNGTYQIAGRFFGRTGISVAASPNYVPPADSYVPIAAAAYAIGETAGLASIPAGSTADAIAFMANVPRNEYPAWALEAIGGTP